MQTSAEITFEEVIALHKEVQKSCEIHNWDMFYVFPKLELTKINNRRMLMQRVDCINDNITLYERPGKEFDIFRFNPKNMYSGWKILDIHKDRLILLKDILLSIKSWIDGSNVEAIKEYANTIIYGDYESNKLIVEMFKSNTKLEFNSWSDNTGYFYDPEIGEKELLFVRAGFNATYGSECEHCGKKHYNAYKNVAFKIINGQKYCPSCLSSRELNYGKCDMTGNMTFRSHLKFSNSEDKKTVLTALGMTDESKKMEFDIDREKVRAISYLRTCDRCGASYLRNSEYSGYYCSDCRLGTVYSHDTKRFKVLNAEGEIADQVKTHYGFELETNNEGEEFKAAYAINKKISDLVILKHDGSLDSGGFEIVSNTLSYNRFLKERSRIASALKTAMDMGCYSQDTYKTGLHIHVSRAGFDNADHLSRFCSSWYLDKKFTRFIAQRDFGEYRHWNDDIERDPQGYFKEFLRGNLYENRDRSRSRYQIVNLNNRDTVELRMFKGILSIDYLSFAIEISELVKNYTKGASDEDFCRKDMIRYVIKNATRKLRGWLNSYLLQEKYAIKEGK